MNTLLNRFRRIPPGMLFVGTVDMFTFVGFSIMAYRVTVITIIMSFAFPLQRVLEGNMNEGPSYLAGSFARGSVNLLIWAVPAIFSLRVLKALDRKKKHALRMQIILSVFVLLFSNPLAMVLHAAVLALIFADARTRAFIQTPPDDCAPGS